MRSSSILLAAVLVVAAPLAMAQSKSKSTGKTPHCYDVQVEKPKEVKDEHKIAGTAIGAVAGGLLGNQIGGGSGKTIATVAGAAGGAYAGRKIQENNQNKTETVTERRCD
ncbi:glycine zipper 2TM domain-containing protein [Lysobacter sp. TAF61]|uniref:glycine zipper 2TM domain-containing protein n=1 Tax=Lysobacter sp. TAF61 TaxID=3233072 RepID=UPI003F994576